MVKALDDLKHEHRLIERVLAVLERATQQLERGEEVSPDTLAGALTFVRGFAEGCHHAKEEHGLFPVLSAKSPAIQGGPVRVLTADHEAGRDLMRELERAIEAMRAGRAGGASQACRALRQYTHMLRRHIAKEEEILFPLSEGLLTDEDAESLDEHFERVEEQTGAGAHKRYEALVEELESAVGAGSGAAHHPH
jgi:hemerythrin-like domain-containing protein